MIDYLIQFFTGGTLKHSGQINHSNYSAYISKMYKGVDGGGGVCTF